LKRQGRAAKEDAYGIAAVLAKARASLSRLTPQETLAAAERGAIVVDTRTEAQRKNQGEIPGVQVIDRTVLEWRLDPASADRIPEAVDYDVEIVIICRQGYSSSLAAASLRSIGLWRATDMIGGAEAWIEAGLPLNSAPPDIRP
jgi:rhodanese-related sulfurtransferase